MLIEYLMTLPPPILSWPLSLFINVLSFDFPPCSIPSDSSWDHYHRHRRLLSPAPFACCLCFSSPAFHFSIDFNLKGQVSLFVKVAVCVMYGTLFFPLSLSVSLHGGDGTSYLMPGQLLINSFFQIK